MEILYKRLLTKDLSGTANITSNVKSLKIKRNVTVRFFWKMLPKDPTSNAYKRTKTMKYNATDV